MSKSLSSALFLSYVTKLTEGAEALTFGHLQLFGYTLTKVNATVFQRLV